MKCECGHNMKLKDKYRYDYYKDTLITTTTALCNKCARIINTCTEHKDTFL